MVDFLSGVLGGVSGAGNAVSEIATDKMHELAEHLKLKAMEEINARSDERRFGYDKAIQGENQKFEAGQNKEKRDFEKGLFDTEIASKEKLAAADRASAEGIANARNELLRAQTEAKKNGVSAATQKVQAEAGKNSLEVLRSGGTLEEANAILDTAGVGKRWEPYDAEPGKEGLFGDTPPVKGYRLVSADGSAPAESSGKKGGTSQLDSLLAKGQAMGAPAGGAPPAPPKKDSGLIEPSSPNMDQSKSNIGNKYLKAIAGKKIESPVLKDGVVWANVNGKTVRIATEPSKKIYSNRYDNPEYAQYLELLKKLGL